jgi:hypothetical protein
VRELTADFSDNDNDKLSIIVEDDDDGDDVEITHYSGTFRFHSRGDWASDDQIVKNAAGRITDRLEYRKMILLLQNV